MNSDFLKNKKNILLIGIAGILFIVAIIVLINENKPKSQVSVDDFISHEVEQSHGNTEISTNVGIDDSIKNEPIVRDINSDRMTEIEVKDYTNDERTITKFDDIWNIHPDRQNEYMYLYDLVWDSECLTSPANYLPMAYQINYFASYENDANEQKETIMHIADSFLEEHKNIIGMKNTDIINLYDIPYDCIYILAEEDDGYYSLRIDVPSTGDKIVPVYITVLNKDNKIVRNTSAIVQREMSYVDEMLDKAGMKIDAEVILFNNGDYIKEYDGDLANADESTLSEEDKITKILLGL